MQEINNSQYIDLLTLASLVFFLLSGIIAILIIVFIQKYKQKQAELLNAIIDNQEQERKRIGADLHDEIGPLLSAAKIQLEFLKSGEKHEPDFIPEFQQLIDDIFTGIRTSVQSLVPNSLYNFGLTTAVFELCNKLNSTECVIEFTHEHAVEFELRDQLNIYRIIQELLTNALKHAQASSISVRFKQVKNNFFVEVSDNGIGFDTTISSNGNGLKNIRSRITILKGDLLIRSKEHKGTLIKLRIPYAQYA